MFQNPVTKKLEGKRIQPVQNNRNDGNAMLIPPYVLTGGEKPGKQVVYSNVIAHLLRNLEFVIKRSRNKCAMTGLNILPLTLPLSRKGRGKCTSRFTLHTSLKKRAAFTLAEVLITLGIIGVVAAITMPSVIGHYKRQETAAHN